MINSMNTTPLENKETNDSFQDNLSQESMADYTISSDYLDFINRNLLSGGVAKDGIPAIDHPKYLSVAESKLFDNDLVYGINYKGFIAAFPRVIMYQHEIVNEEVQGEKISLTYCPLTGSAIGYIGKNLGVSGKLYNSNLVFYDRETDTNYPQILGVGLDKGGRSEVLATFPITTTTWGVWKAAHPETKVLSEDTGFGRDYSGTPYPGYDDALRVWFPVAAQNDTFHSKKIIHGVEVGAEHFALDKDYLILQKEIILETTQGQVVVRYDPVQKSITAVDENGDLLKSFDVFWFAWYAYHPDTKVISH